MPEGPPTTRESPKRKNEVPFASCSRWFSAHKGLLESPRAAISRHAEAGQLSWKKRPQPSSGPPAKGQQHCRLRLGAAVDRLPSFTPLSTRVPSTLPVFKRAGNQARFPKQKCHKQARAEGDSCQENTRGLGKVFAPISPPHLPSPLPVGFTTVIFFCTLQQPQ